MSVAALPPPELEVVDLVATRGGHPVLNGVTFSLAPGVCALLGRNGAGKTSLIRLICGLGRVDAGTIRRSGENIRSSRDSMRRHQTGLGWLPQHPGAHPGMTVIRFLEYAAWLKLIPRGSIADAIDRALQLCNVDTLRSRRIGQLSGGERQRVMLSAVLLAKPTLLVLDEPTAGLDPAQREEVLAVVGALTEVSVLLATHDVAEAATHARQVIIMDRGAVAKDLDAEAIHGFGPELGVELKRLVTITSERS